MKKMMKLCNSMCKTCLNFLKLRYTRKLVFYLKVLSNMLPINNNIDDKGMNHITFLFPSFFVKIA